MQKSDRREFQRLRLTKPILATIRTSNALVLDLGFGGGLIEHYGTAEPGERFNLAFRWMGADVDLVCDVMRTEVVQKPGGDGKSMVSHTGVRFVAGAGDSIGRLTDLIGTFVGKMLAAQKHNAAGSREESAGKEILAKMGAAHRMRSRGFVSYRLKGNSWWRVPTKSSAQPPDGFTVGAHEDPDEIDILCRSYAAADEEGRRLIRLVSELSVESAKD